MLTDKQFEILKNIIDKDLRVAQNNANSMPTSELEESPFYVDYLINIKAIRKEIEIMREEYQEAENIFLSNGWISAFGEYDLVESFWVKILSDQTISIFLVYKDGTEVTFQYSGPYLLEWKNNAEKP